MFAQSVRDDQLTFSSVDKLWVLNKLAIYLFGDDDNKAQMLSNRRIRKLDRKLKGRRLRRNVEDTDPSMGRLSFAQEYHILSKISELLKQQTEEPDYTNLLNKMQNQG